MKKLLIILPFLMSLNLQAPTVFTRTLDKPVDLVVPNGEFQTIIPDGSVFATIRIVTVDECDRLTANPIFSCTQFETHLRLSGDGFIDDTITLLIENGTELPGTFISNTEVDFLVTEKGIILLETGTYKARIRFGSSIFSNNFNLIFQK